MDHVLALEKRGRAVRPYAAETLLVKSGGGELDVFSDHVRELPERRGCEVRSNGTVTRC